MNWKAAIFLSFLFLGQDVIQAQTWTLASGAPTNLDWTAITTSAIGSNAVAGTSSGAIYFSTNSGQSWVAASVPVYHWEGLASSADGSKVVMIGGLTSSPYTGPMYVSTNYGSNWSNIGLTSRTWSGVAMSPDGKNIVASDSATDVLLISQDGGSTWRTNMPASLAWIKVVISGDGTKIVAAPRQGPLYMSFDGGNSWASNSLGAMFPDWGTISSSVDGARLLAAIGGNGGALYTTTNFSGLWISNAVPLGVWTSSASSADGMTLLGANYPTIYCTTNGGVNWKTNSLPKSTYAVAMSADGSRWFAAGFPGGIYTLQNIPAPLLKTSISNDQIALSWVLPATNFILQQTSDLAGTNWITISNSPTFNPTNLQNQLTIPMSGNSGFFRLSTQ